MGQPFWGFCSSEPGGGALGSQGGGVPEGFYSHLPELFVKTASIS